VQYAKAWIQITVFFFYGKSYKEKQTQKERNPTGLYKNGHNWLTHKLCHLGIEPSTLRHSVRVIQHQKFEQIIL
jgi:hypothetical protein